MTFAEFDNRFGRRFSRILNGNIGKRLHLEDSDELSGIINHIAELSELNDIGEAEVKEFQTALIDLKELQKDVPAEYAEEQSVKSFFNGLKITIDNLGNLAKEFRVEDVDGIPEYLLGENNLQDRLLKNVTDTAAPGTEIYIPDSMFSPDGEIGNPKNDPDEIRERPVFPEGGPKVGDVIQKEDKACFLLANLVGIANADPGEIWKLITDNEDGTVTVHLNAIRNREEKVPLNIRIDKTAGSMDPESKDWVKYIEKAVAASHIVQTGGEYPEGLRKMVADKTLPKIGLPDNMNGGAPELAYNILTPEKLVNPQTLKNDMMLSDSFDEAKRVLMNRMSRAFRSGGSIFMYTDSHVVSINAVSDEYGNSVSIYDQRSEMNRDGRASKVRLEDILSGAVKVNGEQYRMIQINEPDLNGRGVKTDSLYLIGLEYEYNRFQRPEKEEIKDGPEDEIKDEPTLIKRDDAENEININTDSRPKLNMDDSEDEININTDSRPKLNMDDDEHQFINKPEDPKNQIPAKFIVSRIARLNKEMQATATFSPKTSRKMMDNLKALNRYAQANKDDPEVIGHIFESPEFANFAKSAVAYIEKWNENTKNGQTLNDKQIAKIKVSSKLMGLATAVVSGKTLPEYKNYMLAEKIMINNNISYYKAYPEDGLRDFVRFSDLKAATDELMNTKIYKSILSQFKINPAVESETLDRLIRTPTEKIMDAVSIPHDGERTPNPDEPQLRN